MRSDIIDSQTLAAVVALAELQSFRAVAETLKISKPKVTRLIQKAESDFGAKIFERTGRGAVLTLIGREFVARCQSLASEIDDFSRDVDKLRGSGAVLTIGCGHLATSAVVEPALLTLLHDMPDIRARIYVRGNKDALAGLLDRRVDIFVGDLTHTPQFSGLDIQVVKQYEVIFVANPLHPVHRNGPQALGELLRYPLVMAHLHKYWRGVFQQALVEEGDAGNEAWTIPKLECDDFALTTGLVARSSFLTAGIRENFAEHFEAGTLRKIEMTSPLSWTACAARRSNSGLPELDHFWRILTEVGTKKTS
ncbi:MAG: LysR family transcriptional regulator [Paracoccaceae bacterium]